MTGTKTKKKINQKPSRSERKKTPAVKQTKPSSQPSKGPMTAIRSKLMKSVCALTDPFCSHAIGSKYPDASSAKTLAFTKREMITLATIATGQCNVFVAPSYGPFNPYSVGGVGGGLSACTPPIAAAHVPVAGVTSYRIVSWGLKLRRISAPLSSAGMVHIRIFADEDWSTLGTFDTLSLARSVTYDIPLQDCKDLAIVGPRGSQRPEAVYSEITNATLSLNGPAGFNAVNIYVDGAPASVGVLSVEFIFHYELLFDDTSSMQFFATKAPPASPIVVAAANLVTSTSENIFEKGVSMVGKYIERKAMMALGGFLGGPAGAAGMGMLALTVD